MNTVAVHPGLVNINDTVSIGSMTVEIKGKGRVDNNVRFIKGQIKESGNLYYHEYGNNSKKIEKII